MPADADQPRARSLSPDTPVGRAARRVLTRRLRSVQRLLPAAADGSAEHVHELRVATRRAQSAVRAFRPWLKDGWRRRVARVLSDVRGVAGRVRDPDVQAALFGQVRHAAPADLARGIDAVLAWLREQRARALDELRSAGDGPGARRLRSLRSRRRVRQAVVRARGLTLARAAGRGVGPIVERARRAAAQDLSDLEHLHDLRIACKRLRYALEVFKPALGPGVRDGFEERFRAVQERLGAVNDSHTTLARLDAFLSGPAAERLDEPARAALGRLGARARVLLESRRERACAWVTSGEFGRLLDDVEAALEDAAADAAAPELGGSIESTGACEAPGAAPEAPSRPSATWAFGAGPAGADPVEVGPVGAGRLNGASDHPRRLAAIDVGSNSIRLLVAEVSPDGAVRVLDDERETVRLAAGLETSGRLGPEAIDRAALAVARMRGIADGYHITRVRCVGTSAAREASNGDELVRRVRERAGLTLELIGPEQEARLAYLSVSHAFDLSGVHAGVVDLGGGSCELVLTAGGVIERVFSMPLGAVRLTERFAPDAGGEGFRRLRRHVSDELERVVGRPAHPLQVLIGTGGTFTTIAQVLLAGEGAGGSGGGASASRVRGVELHRSDVLHVLDRLRKTPTRSRARLAGLSPARSDIIVAGVAVVDRLMKHLGVNTLRVHDGGIREGLILELAGVGPPGGREADPAGAGAGQGVFEFARERQDADLFPGGLSGRDRDRWREVRRFADACRYEHRHCDHVARLSAAIFDQLDGAARDRWGDPAWGAEGARFLLLAAAVLHDAGYQVNYQQHHLHSYHLIVHSGMMGFSARELEVIAQVARYHRKAEPSRSHEAFARLGRADRRLVRRLSAVLRVADGLDRAHTQNVSGVRVRVGEGRAEFRVLAKSDPGVDLWGAERKSGLLGEVFDADPEFVWQGPGQEPGEPSAGSGGPDVVVLGGQAIRAAGSDARPGRLGPGKGAGADRAGDGRECPSDDAVGVGGESVGRLDG